MPSLCASGRPQGTTQLSVWLYLRFLERAMGIEPTALAWEARVLPLYDAR